MKLLITVLLLIGALLTLFYLLNFYLLNKDIFLNMIHNHWKQMGLKLKNAFRLIRVKIKLFSNIYFLICKNKKMMMSFIVFLHDKVYPPFL